MNAVQRRAAWACYEQCLSPGARTTRIIRLLMLSLSALETQEGIILMMEGSRLVEVESPATMTEWERRTWIKLGGRRRGARVKIVVRLGVEVEVATKGEDVTARKRAER